MDHWLMGIKQAVLLAVMRESVAGRITVPEGMRRTGLSRRQFLRYKRRYRDHGPPGLFHGNRGRPSSRRIDEEVRQRVIALLDQPVALNDRHIRDVLAEEGRSLCAETVRRIRRGLGRPPKQRRRPRRYRQRRDRAAQIGALALIDGSPFRWLGPAQPACTLVGAIDDATGQILGLIVRDEEDLHGYTELLQHIVVTHGVPWTLYGDRAAILVRNDRYWTVEEELRGRQRPSHFGQMLEELGIRYIAALSPQAKGRIERLWRTLQDRLAAELQLHGISDRAAFIAFLPGFIERFNQTFAKAPQNAVAVWRHAPAKLDTILACRYPRVVAPDNTVAFEGQRLAIPPGPHRRSYARCEVEVREQLDGRCLVRYNGHTLFERAAPEEAFRLQPRGSSRSHRNHPDEPVRVPPKAIPRPPHAIDKPRPKSGSAWRRGTDYRLGKRKEERQGVS